MEIVMKKPTVPGAEKPGGERPPVYRGKPGPQGPAGTIEIAQVVTIEPSDPARIENIGDSTNAKLILYIPKGDPGNRGEPGPAVEITEDIIQAITNELDLTPELVGLGNVDNTSDMDKPVSNAQAEAIAQVQSDVRNHVADENNPHGVTIAQIGAAPAGYGLGGTGAEVRGSALIDETVNNGWYVFHSDAGGNWEPFDTGCMLVLNRDGNYVTQIAFKDSGTMTYIKIRKRTQGTWGPWEWLSHPMTEGVEYRTVFRVNDRPVYDYLFKYGYYSTATTSIEHGISGIYQPVSIEITNNIAELLTNSSGITTLSFNRTAISISAAWNMGNVHFMMKYTK